MQRHTELNDCCALNSTQSARANRIAAVFFSALLVGGALLTSCTGGGDFAGNTKSDKKEKSENAGGSLDANDDATDPSTPEPAAEGGGTADDSVAGDDGDDNDDDQSDDDDGDDGDDDGDDDDDSDDVGSDDGSTTVKLRGNLTIKTLVSDRQGENRVKVQYISAKGDGEWHTVKLPKEGASVVVPGVCLKNGATELRVRLLGKNEYKPGDTNVGLYRVNGAEVQLTVDMNGCGMFGTCIDPGKDTTLSFVCSKYDLLVEGVN